MSESPTSLAAPVVETADAVEIARDAVVLPNRGVELVPNVGVIGGTEAVLVVETGMARSTGRPCWPSPTSTRGAGGSS